MSRRAASRARSGNRTLIVSNTRVLEVNEEKDSVREVRYSLSDYYMTPLCHDVEEAVEYLLNANLFRRVKVMDGPQAESMIEAIIAGVVGKEEAAVGTAA